MELETATAAARRILGSTLGKVLRALGYGLVGAVVIIVVVLVVHLESRPDLAVWHTVELDEEFTAASDASSFAGYLALEERLFRQLDELVYAQTGPAGPHSIKRYRRGGAADPGRWSRNWNRSFELTVEGPRAGVLLIHGMSDSPYSLRSLAARFHAAGAYALGLRVPGHGTAPSGLLDVRWEDMAAAVELAAAHVREQVGPDRPLFLVGYSNGGALAVHYALAALEDDALPAPTGLVLLSPEIGITKLAALAKWQERFGHLLGLEKLAWNSLSPEYDPYKYQSFALNAGSQAYRITVEIQALITRLTKRGLLSRFPMTLAFQSVADATVTAPALVRGLFARLPEADHELVLFDINRRAEIEPIMNDRSRRDMEAALESADRPFSLTLITNKRPDSREVVARHAGPDGSESESDLGLVWPDDVYSLSHVSLPFPPDDPLYGISPGEGEGPRLSLGNLAPRGERGVLEIPPADFLRLRWNPFHAYVVERALAFMQLSDE